jgi:hypothetical protein
MSFARVAAVLLNSALVLYSQGHQKDEKAQSPTDFLRPFNADSLVLAKLPIQFTYRAQEKGSGLPHLTFESFGQSGRMDESGSAYQP